MYIKNISELFKEQIPIKFKFFEGNTIYAKIISLEEGKGAIKLYDGTILPAIFINDNINDIDKYIKFLIQSYDGKNLLLKPLENNNEDLTNDSLIYMLNDMKVPVKEGREIIKSLINFNLPTTGENIITEFKVLNTIKEIKSMSQEDIYSFINKRINNENMENTSQIQTAKGLFNDIQSLNTDFVSLLIENSIPIDFENIISVKNFINNKFVLNDLIDSLKEIVKIKTDKDSIVSLDNIIKTIKNYPEELSGVPQKQINDLADNANLLKKLYNNYILYFFNTYNDDFLFKNSIIVKKRYKLLRPVDPDDVKASISVEAPKLGLVEALLHKKRRDLNITLKVDKKFIELFKSKALILKENLHASGYNVISLSVEELKKPSTLIDLSDFFNDNIFAELDVKV